ncbi:MAG TPA: YHS domain-containing (seleno)protein [Planctomycetota bacterium]
MSPAPLLRALALLAFLLPQEPPPSPQARPRDLTHFNLDRQALALQGYDPVAYFAAGGGKPRKGLASLTARHDGVLYRFASEANRKLFLASPAAFEPQYGGWCAYAMADGEKVAIDPESFLVTEGKLTLFFKAWYADTRAKWRKDEARLTRKADEAWRELNAPRPPK